MLEWHVNNLGERYAFYQWHGPLTLSLDDFLRGMEQGWDFRKPIMVKAIGRSLRRAFVAAGTDLSVVVKAEFVKTEGGSGADGWINYAWEVRGVALPEFTERPSYEERALFGGLTPAGATRLPSGFVVEYGK